VVARCNSAAPIPPVGLSPAVLAQLVTAQIQLLRSLQATIGELDAAIKQRVAQHPRAKLLLGLPGVGTINLAQLLAEVGPILDRVPTAEQAAPERGAAPVTRASGKTSGIYFRLTVRCSWRGVVSGGQLLTTLGGATGWSGVSPERARVPHSWLPG
jgi:transposase